MNRLKNFMTVIGGLFALGVFLTGCNDSVANSGMPAQPPQTLPVFQVHPADAATFDQPSPLRWKVPETWKSGLR